MVTKFRLLNMDKYIFSHLSQLLYVVNFPLSDFILSAATLEKVLLDIFAQQRLNKPEHLCSLIRVFAIHKKKLCILGLPKSAQWRFWSAWTTAKADLNLCWAHFRRYIFRLHLYGKWNFQGSRKVILEVKYWYSSQKLIPRKHILRDIRIISLVILMTSHNGNFGKTWKCITTNYQRPI